MKKSIFYGLTLGFLMSSCGSGSGYEGSGGTIEQQVETQSYEQVQQTQEQIEQELKEREWSQPLQFLSIQNGTYRKNLLGEFVLEGSIFNSATEASFKDARIEVVFYTKTRTELKRTTRSVIEFFKPGKSKSFKIKLFGPNQAKKVGFDLVGATAVRN